MCVRRGFVWNLETTLTFRFVTLRVRIGILFRVIFRFLSAPQDGRAEQIQRPSGSTWTCPQCRRFFVANNWTTRHTSHWFENLLPSFLRVRPPTWPPSIVPSVLLVRAVQVLVDRILPRFPVDKVIIQ
jgi:hypothetical protein